MDAIILIGMPNVGKTTIGKILAKNTNKKFIDTDEIILDKTKLSPREIVKQKGEDYFLNLQQEILLKEDILNSIVSTGGSVIYNSKLMDYLGKNGDIIYLYGNLEELSKRMTQERKIIGSKSNDFEALYKQRDILYKKYANIEIDCDNKSFAKIAEEIERNVTKNG